MLIDLTKENGFTLKKTRSRQYPAETITVTDYAEDLVLLAITSTQAKSFLQSQKYAAEGVGLHMNINQTEYICLIKEEPSPL